MNPGTERWRSWPLALVCLLLSAACIAVYAPGLAGPFLMDDFDAIHPLAVIQSSGASWWDTLQSAPAHIRARWLSNLSFLLTNAAAGSPMPPSPYAYKLGNLAVHLACAAAGFLLALALLRRWNLDARRRTWIAAFAAGVFLLHPLLLSTVLYPVQRMAQLATLFALLAVWIYVCWRENLARWSPAAHTAAVGAILACIALAVSSKESGALAPLLIGVVELTAFRWPARDDPHRGRFDLGFGLSCAAPLMLGAVLLVLRWPTLMSGYAARDFDMAQRAMTQLHVLASYLAQFAWPRIAGLGLYRDDFPLTTQLDLPTGLLAASFVAIVVAALVARRRWPIPAFGVLWFVAAHAMESTLLPLELVFEHRNYLALLGPALVAAWLLSRLPGIAAIALGVALLAGLGVQTARRATDWSDYGRWIAAEVAHHPLSLRAGSDRIAYLASRGEADAAAQALQDLRRRFPAHAQPVLVQMSLECELAAPSGRFPNDEEARRLREGHVGKDAFHVFTALRDRKRADACAGVDWATFARVAADVAGNPGVQAQARASAAWHRLHAGALTRIGDWPGVAAAIERALQAQDDDPRDWLLLMQAQVELRDAPAYLRARSRLLALMGNDPGPFAQQLTALDAVAMRLPAKSE